MSITKLQSAAVAAALALIVGSYFEGQRHAQQTTAALPAQPSSDVNRQEISTLNAEIARLRAENRRLASGSVPNQLNTHAGAGNTASTADSLHIIAVKVKNREIQPIYYLGADGKILPFLANALGLSAEEQQAIQATLDAAHTRFGKLELANATAQTQTNGSVSIKVTPYDGGADIYDQVADGMEKAIGHDRAADLLAISQEQLDQYFQHFGASGENITVTSNPPSQTGQPPFMVDISTTTNNTQTRMLYGLSQVEMEQKLGPLASLVPAHP